MTRALLLSSLLLAVACGGTSRGDEPAGAATPPGAPSGFMAMEMTGGAHLSWQDTFSNETGFELQRKAGTAEFAKLVEVAANTVEHMDETAPTGTALTYRVRALGAAGPGAWSAEASITLPATPPVGLDAPMQLAIMKMGGSLHVSWMNMAQNPTGFELQRKADGGEFATVKTTSATTTSYADTGVHAGTTYTYRVRALRSADMSAWSAEVSATP